MIYELELKNNSLYVHCTIIISRNKSNICGYPSINLRIEQNKNDMLTKSLRMKIIMIHIDNDL